MAQKGKMKKMAAKYAERAKYFSGKKGQERWNNLEHEGRMRSGVAFSYAKQGMIPRKKGVDLANVRRGKEGDVKKHYGDK